MCAIAYWGLAMANLDDEPRALKFIELATYLKNDRRLVSSRESMYIDSLAAYLKAGPDHDRERREAYVKALEGIVIEHPVDIDARAFLVAQLWKNRESGIPIGSVVAADSLMQQVLTAEPSHSSRLTQVLLWANERHPAALLAARNCGETTPGLPAAWSAAGQLFEHFGNTSEASRRYEAAIRVHLGHAIRELSPPDRRQGDVVSSVASLIRLCATTGRCREAIELAQMLESIPRHPRFNNPAEVDSAATVGRDLLDATLARYEKWDELITGSESEGRNDLRDKVLHLRMSGRVFYSRGEPVRGRSQLDALRIVDKNLRSSDRLPEWMGTFNAAIAELEGWDLLANGRTHEGLTRLRELKELGKNEFVTALVNAGRLEEAHNDLVDETRRAPHDTVLLARLVDIRWKLGLRQEAEQAFVVLRDKAGGLDLELPVFARLGEAARGLGYARDWRTRPFAVSAPLDRIAFDRLGPNRWMPPKAPEWSLKDGQGRTHSLAELQGRPVVVIFYLGTGCVHCVEQLQVFGKHAERFHQAGISLVAIGTDDESTLRRGFSSKGLAPYQFPLLSDTGKKAFADYRLHDDSMLTPLHGTFLVDGQGRLLWCDRDTRPFTDPECLLQESMRLLANAKSKLAARDMPRDGSNSSD
ncbi:MAG: peroxiredoxin family protein [Planctomycetaceae bacterium]|nr:peroxiredoxin family protein [Planctomycetaceae bacterium]